MSLTRRAVVALFLLLLVAGASSRVSAKSTALPTIAPADLVAIMKKPASPQPIIIQVGFKTLFDQAHIPGSEYIGPGADGTGLGMLRQRLAKVKKDAFIVLYCGCCPLEHCPNVKPAEQLLTSMGFTNAKMLLLPENFGADWVAKGYPTQKGK